MSLLAEQAQRRVAVQRQEFQLRHLAANQLWYHDGAEPDGRAAGQRPVAVPARLGERLLEAHNLPAGIPVDVHPVHAGEPAQPQELRCVRHAVSARPQ